MRTRDSQKFLCHCRCVTRRVRRDVQRYQRYCLPTSLLPTATNLYEPTSVRASEKRTTTATAETEARSRGRGVVPPPFHSFIARWSAYPPPEAAPRGNLQNSMQRIRDARIIDDTAVNCSTYIYSSFVTPIESQLDNGPAVISTRTRHSRHCD